MCLLFHESSPGRKSPGLLDSSLGSGASPFSHVVMNGDVIAGPKWFEDEEVPPPKFREHEEEEDSLLEELDGNLRWPSKKRRR